ncbi:hypothetical protein SDC9_197769 [bioreactor metagenome]|uniref:Uncharacterized protein n=1 Tax=bioreactor metagenome TaxID=1076179 RepID=A0A645ISG0_9ZZZZ
MDAAGALVNKREQAIDKRTLELCERAVLKHRRDDRMGVHELFKHFRIGRITVLGLFVCGQAK